MGFLPYALGSDQDKQKSRAAPDQGPGATVSETGTGLRSATGVESLSLQTAVNEMG